MTNRLAWGILGTGGIARAFARGLAESQTGDLVAVGSRSPETAAQFGEAYGVPHRHGSYDALLADPAVRIVYIATPHPMHAEWAIKAAEAGKHILCEKPLTINAEDAQRVIDAARRHDVFLMEAFMYRCHPQIATLVELLRAGVIGEVRVIQAAFSEHFHFGPESRAFAPELGGGGILDVGCYCVSMARLIAGAATGHDFADPVDVHAVGYLGETGVDDYTVAIMQFPGRIVAQLACGTRVQQENVVRIFGSEGSLTLPSPWLAGQVTRTSTLVLQRDDATEPQEYPIEIDRGIYAIEADTVARHLDNRQAPAMSWDDTLGNMRTLDRWRAAIGLTYPME